MPSPEEKFELLSAYMDGEVSREERLQVDQWLAEDPAFRRLYQQQLRLHQMFLEAPVPTAATHPDRLHHVSATPDPDAFARQVMGEIDRRSRRKWFFIGGIGASAALLIGVFGSVFTVSPNRQFSPVANQVTATPIATSPINPASLTNSAKEEPLILAMERPLVPLPKTVPDRE